MSEESATKPIKSVVKNTGLGNRASKNLQFAKELNAEMELMFADEDLKVKNTTIKRQKKRDGKKSQVQFAG